MTRKTLLGASVLALITSAAIAQDDELHGRPQFIQTLPRTPLGLFFRMR